MGRRQSSGDAWTGREIETLKRLYPDRGAKAVAAELPDRSVIAIYGAARDLCIQRRYRHRTQSAGAR